MGIIILWITIMVGAFVYAMYGSHLEQKAEAEAKTEEEKKKKKAEADSKFKRNGIIIAIIICILAFAYGCATSDSDKKSNKWESLTNEEKAWYKRNYGNKQYDKYQNAIDNYKKSK